MSLFGHVVISLSLLQAGLNLTVFKEFMKTCELGLAGRLKGSKGTKAVLPSDFFGRFSNDCTTVVCQTRAIVLYS